MPIIHRSLLYFGAICFQRFDGDYDKTAFIILRFKCPKHAVI